MPKQVMFVQGAGKAVHDSWDNRLVQSLGHELGEDFTILYPRMPDEADPRYAAWKSALLREFERLEDGAIAVGHSIGGTILIHFLAEKTLPIKLGAVFLIAAPFVGEGGWRSDDIPSRQNLGSSLPAGLPIFLYHGTADDIAPFEHLKLHAKAIPQAKVNSLANRDHQLNNDLREVARDIRSLT